MKRVVSLFVLVWSLVVFAEPALQKDRNEAEYNNQYAIVLNGYDPVSYFVEGGAVPVLGDANISIVEGSRSYYFANQANRELFIANPLKYEPTYGSWCAYAMSEGSKITINPLFYTISGNRLHFFVNRSAKRSFDADVSGRESEADVNWKSFSGEEPRI